MPKGLPIVYIKKWGISKLAWRKFRAGALTRGVPTRTASKGRSKGEKTKRGKSMVKRGRRRRGMTIPIAPIMGLAAGLIEPVQTAMQGNMPAAFQTACRNYTGYDPIMMTWDYTWALRGIAPLIAGLLVHKYVGGPPLNLNQVLARAKVPFIRL